MYISSNLENVCEMDDTQAFLIIKVGKQKIRAGTRNTLFVILGLIAICKRVCVKI